VGTPDIWNPLPEFQTVHQDGQLGNIQPVREFMAAADTGSLPAVSWIVPNGTVSEHPPASIGAGQAWVTRLVNAVMESPDWSSSAIFLSWDDWAGSTTTWSHRWWTERATAFAFRAWSSAPTRDRGSSTTRPCPPTRI
jgi:hypothetical protein